MVDRIGHYRIVAELGRGGMGVVYKAHEESLNRFVALKVLGEHLTEDESYIERFLREARSAAALNHPNIVQIYQVGEQDGKHYFAMEFVDGQSLQQILRASGPVDELQVARIALQTASGLQAAHERGVIHRDIKPANLLIDERGLVKIADFGLALMGGAASRLTATGMFMGTPGYLSPEQCLDQNVDERTDIYSLGVTLFEALSGKVPFTADSPLALLRQIVEVDPPDLAELVPEVDAEFRGLVSRMMAKQRDERTASCAELIAGVENFLETRGGAGNLAVRLAASSTAVMPPPPPPPEIESQPTTALSSDQNDVIGESPSPASAPAAGPTQVPVVETSPVAEPGTPGRGRLALVAVLVVVLGIAAIVVGGVVAWRTGFLPFASVGPATDDDQRSTVPVTDENDAGTAAEDLADADDPADDAASDRGASAVAGVQDPDSEPPSEAPGIDMPADRSPESTVVKDVTEGTDIEAGEPSSHAAPPAAPPARRPPPPEGTVVIAVGEELFAGEAENVIERALSRAGITLVDEHGVPGASALISGMAEREPGELHRLLRPYARYAVVIRVEYLGERPLMYMGQRDVAFQARVTVVPVDLQGERPVASPTRVRVEYTHLNAERVAHDTLRSVARELIRQVGGR